MPLRPYDLSTRGPYEQIQEARTLARYERDRRRRAEEKLRELRGQLEQFRLAVVEELEAVGCEVAACSDDPPTNCLWVARGMLEARREKLAAYEAELAKVSDVIARGCVAGGVSAERKGRDMHDWLAQVLQVLVGRMGLAEQQAQQARAAKCDCWKYDRQVCDVCCGKDSRDVEPSPMVARNERLYRERWLD